MTQQIETHTFGKYAVIGFQMKPNEEGHVIFRVLRIVRKDTEFAIAFIDHDEHGLKGGDIFIKYPAFVDGPLFQIGLELDGFSFAAPIHNIHDTKIVASVLRAGLIAYVKSMVVDTLGLLNQVVQDELGEDPDADISRHGHQSTEWLCLQMRLTERGRKILEPAINETIAEYN